MEENIRQRVPTIPMGVINMIAEVTSSRNDGWTKKGYENQLAAVREYVEMAMGLTRMHPVFDIKMIPSEVVQFAVSMVSSEEQTEREHALRVFQMIRERIGMVLEG